MSGRGVKEGTATRGWFRGGTGQLRGLLVVSLILVLAGGVTVFGSATALTQLTDSLVAVAHEQAGRSARMACAEIREIAKSAKGETLRDVVSDPDLQRRLRSLSGNYDVVLATLVSPEGDPLSHYYCHNRLSRMPTETAEAVRSPSCIQGKTLDVIPAGLLPEGVVPVQEEIWRDGQMLGYIRVFGVSDIEAMSQIDPIRLRIAAILSFMVLLVFGILMLALAVIYWTMLRQAELLNRTAQMEQLAEIGSLASGLAHEIRNPLQSMSLHLDLAREELDEEDPGRIDRLGLTKGLGLIQTQTHRLNQLVETFAGMARVREVQGEETDLARLAGKVVGRMTPQMEKEGIDFKVEIPETLPLRSAPGVLTKAMENLLSRSMEILSKCEDRKVWLRAREEGSHVVVEVEDNGPTLSREDAETIFQPFVEGDMGRRCLALSMTRRLAESIGGKLEAHPGDGCGARFVLKIPRRFQG